MSNFFGQQTNKTNRKRDREPFSKFPGYDPEYTGPVAMDMQEDDTCASQPTVFNFDPEPKKIMTKQCPERYTQHIPLDLTILNAKIEEVAMLLEELHRMRDYFESKNKKDEPLPSYFC